MVDEDIETDMDILRTIRDSLPGISYKGKDRTTTTGAAEELTIPADSTKVIITCAADSDGYVELNGNASTSSPIYINELTPLELGLGSVTKLSVWVVAGYMGAVFYGQS